MERHALFFTDKDARRIYKENVKYTLTRRSTLTGRAYKDDPTIMAWGLLNEPRCETWKVLPHARACWVVAVLACTGLHRSREVLLGLLAHESGVQRRGGRACTRMEPSVCEGLGKPIAGMHLKMIMKDPLIMIAICA